MIVVRSQPFKNRKSVVSREPAITRQFMENEIAPLMVTRDSYSLSTGKKKTRGRSCRSLGAQISSSNHR